MLSRMRAIETQRVCLPKMQNNLTPEDKQLLDQANSLISLQESKEWQDYLLPFLLNLSQEGYPNPKEYDNNEKLILDYTLKVGETSAIKKIIQFFQEQYSVRDTITTKLKPKDDPAV